MGIHVLGYLVTNIGPKLDFKLIESAAAKQADVERGVIRTRNHVVAFDQHRPITSFTLS